MDRRDVLKSSGSGMGAYNAFWRDAQAQGTSRAPKLKITAIRTAKFNKVSHTFVRIYTDQGVTGTGEFSDEIMAAEIAQEFFAPKLVAEGWNPLDIEKITHWMWSTARLSVYIRGWGGPYLAALSGLDMALWDLAGKALGVPIYRLMGGRVRPKVPVYFDILGGGDVAAETIRISGVKMIKGGIDGITRASTPQHAFDPTRPTALQVSKYQLDEIVDYVGKFRAAVGKTNMAIEMHASYSVESAIRIGQAIAPFEPAWIEEPILSANADAMAEVRRSVPVPVACGENIYTRYDFRPYFEKQAMSVAQPDMAKTGGLSEGRKIAAAAHVCTTIPNLFALEGGRTDTLWGPDSSAQYAQMMPRPVYKDGFLELPEGPGVGIELNQDFINEHLLHGQEFPAA